MRKIEGIYDNSLITDFNSDTTLLYALHSHYSYSKDLEITISYQFQDINMLCIAICMGIVSASFIYTNVVLTK